VANGNSVKIKIDGDASGFKKTLSSIGGLATKSIAGIAKVSTAITAAGKAISVMGVKYNAEIENLQTSFEVMTGSAEKATEVVSRLRKLGAETPYEMTDLASTTQLLMQYGFAADDAIDKMTMLGDVAQGNRDAMVSIATGYAQMSSAGKVNLQDIKQMINGGFNPLQEISERTGESMASLYDRISKGSMQVDEITESMKAATSEGGKFFGSMEKQSKTLNGQLSTLKDNANQLLGALTEDMSSGLRDELLPLANNLIGELQESFESGGVDGLVNAATDMIPDLLGMMTGRLEDAISGVTRWLPQGASKIMAAFPSALKSATAVVPQMTTALFEISSTVVTDLVSMLPELLPILGEGFINLAGSILTGAESVIEGIFTGVDRAFHAGQSKIAGVWVDNESVATIKASIEADINVEDAESQIKTAYSAIRNALNTDLLTPEEKAQIIDMIGSDYDDIKAKLLSFGLTEQEAGPIADAISTAGDTLIQAYSGLNIGIDPTTLAKLTAQANGSRIVLKGLLKDVGLSEADISQVVGVYDEMIGKVGEQTPSIIEEIYNKLTDGKPDDEQTVAVLGTKIADYIEGLLTELETAYEAKSAQLDTTAADYEQRKAELDEWYTSTKTSITNMNTDMSTLVDTLAGAPTAVVQARMEELAEMERTLLGIEQEIENLNGKTISAAQNAFTVVRSGASADKETIGTAIKLKVTEFKVDEQSAEDAYNAAVEQLNADLATGKVSKTEYDTKMESLQAERDSAKQAAKQAFEKAMTEIFQGIAESEGNEEALQKAMDATGAKLSIQDFIDNMYTEEGGFNTDKLSALSEQLASVLGDAFNPEALESYLTTGDTLGLLDYLDTMAAAIDASSAESLETALGGKVGAAWQAAVESGVLKGTSFDVTGTQDQLAALFSAIDLSDVGDDAMAGVGEGIATHDFGTAAARAEQRMESDMRSALQSNSPAKKMVPIGDDVAAGVGEGMAEHDFSTDAGTMASSAESVAKSKLKSAGSTAGKQFSAGLASGIRSGKSAVTTAAAEVAAAAIAAANKKLEINSPSKATMRSGHSFGEGFSIGIQDSMRNAVAVAKQMTGQLVTAADISRLSNVAMSGITQEVSVVSDQAPTPVYLDGRQIAEIQGHNNSMQLAWQNNKSAKGVGSR
jgi:tape measure domain-containing protein